MLRKLFLLSCALLPVSCANLPISVPDTAQLRPGEISQIDQDVAAVNYALWAFADPGRTRGRPAYAARAVASMDYIAGELNTSPRWAHIDGITQMQLLKGREQMRVALGIAPGARSQQVVDQLSATSDALFNNDQAAALRDLSGPAFVLPPQTVLARLANMPYIQMANVSTMRAGNELFGPGNEENWF